MKTNISPRLNKTVRINEVIELMKTEGLLPVTYNSNSVMRVVSKQSSLGTTRVIHKDFHSNNIM